MRATRIAADVLLCPGCGYNNLHHEAIEVFERSHEDASDGLHVIIEKGVVEVDADLHRNPSPRRHGLSIHFWCETCAVLPVLTIAQHKGETLVTWDWTQTITAPRPEMNSP
jgi:hypothetical protein